MAATSPIPICRERVVSIQQQEGPAGFVLANRAKILLRPFLAGYIGVGDEIAFPVPSVNQSHSQGRQHLKGTDTEASRE